ncbi:MAG: Riboflavin transporter, partial [Alphaproteobacteria bacterium MarineAlpha5_Bin10]
MLNNSQKGILLIIFGMSIFSIQDVLVKYLSDSTSVFQIFFVRSIVGLLVIGIYLSLTRKKVIFKSQYPLLTLLRVVLFFSAFLAFYISLSNLSLAIANTLFFTSPFFITIFSMIFLKERIGIRRWAAIIIGFLGVLIVMNPKVENLNLFYLLPVYCAV